MEGDDEGEGEAQGDHEAKAHVLDRLERVVSEPLNATGISPEYRIGAP